MSRCLSPCLPSGNKADLDKGRGGHSPSLGPKGPALYLLLPGCATAAAGMSWPGKDMVLPP